MSCINQAMMGIGKVECRNITETETKRLLDCNFSYLWIRNTERLIQEQWQEEWKVGGTLERCN